MKKILNRFSNFSSLQIIRSRRGIALLIAIFAMILTITIAVEVSYETSVGYVQAAQQVNRLKAYYAAKSGVDLSLFRIMLYRKVLAQYGQQLSGNQGLVDMIWKMPFSWPPMLPSASKILREDINSKLKKSFMDAQFSTTIESENARIDINALGSGNQALINATRIQLLQLFQNAINNNREFKKKYQDYNFNSLLDNIEDWVSPGNIGVGGRDKSQLYKQPDNVQNYHLPADEPFKTLGELHMVAGMKDDFYNVLKHNVTVYGSFGINVNYADSQVLESLDPQITAAVVKKIIARRSDPALGGPFQSSNDFYSFLQGLGVNTSGMERNNMPLQFGSVYNFRITSVGSYRNVTRQIVVVTYDVDSVATRYAKILTQSTQNNGQNPPPPPNQNQNPGPTPPNNQQPNNMQNQAPAGRPRIVMWNVS